MWPFSSRRSGLDAQPQYLDELPDEPVKMSAAKKGGIAGGTVLAILAAIYANEGGFVDHPNDPGGATNYGVTEKVARQAGYTGSMRNFPKHCVGPTKACADEIYITKYMKQPGYWPLIDLEPAVAEELIDTAVNMGPPRPSKWFQQSLNQLCASNLAIDGRVGPRTLAAYMDCQTRVQGLCVAMVRSLDAKQKAEYDRLVRVNPSLKVFYKGWTNHRIGNVDLRKCA